MPSNIVALTPSMVMLLAAVANMAFGCIEVEWVHGNMFDKHALTSKLVQFIWKQGVGDIARAVTGEMSEKVSLNNFADFVAKKYGVPVVFKDFEGFDLDNDGFITNDEVAECLMRIDFEYF